MYSAYLWYHIGEKSLKLSVWLQILASIISFIFVRISRNAFPPPRPKRLTQNIWLKKKKKKYTCDDSYGFWTLASQKPDNCPKLGCGLKLVLFDLRSKSCRLNTQKQYCF